MGLIQLVVTSFGYLHGKPPSMPTAHHIEDVRKALRDPHVDPAFRELDGFDPRVQQRVLNTPGASDLLRTLQNRTNRLLEHNNKPFEPYLVGVAIGCAGGRHRSVVLANELAERMRRWGWGVEVEHRDIRKPVVKR
ncbi:RapZ C-terminal domain-containing protein [Saccharopolyspora taberi]|uniref:RNase adapter RapZ n=1 Tax=Saccharopolyspora taberi TaxID=60895 RepID=A0ABN3V5E8_9PSEU